MKESPLASLLKHQQAKHDQIDQHLAEFKARGGKIDVLPHGASSKYSAPLSDERRRRLHDEHRAKVREEGS